jgi:hypothetical protein
MVNEVELALAQEVDSTTDGESDSVSIAAPELHESYASIASTEHDRDQQTSKKHLPQLKLVNETDNCSSKPGADTVKATKPDSEISTERGGLSNFEKAKLSALQLSEVSPLRPGGPKKPNEGGKKVDDGATKPAEVDPIRRAGAAPAETRAEAVATGRRAGEATEHKQDEKPHKLDQKLQRPEEKLQRPGEKLQPLLYDGLNRPNEKPYEYA